MKLSRETIRVSVTALRFELHRISYDANMADKYRATYPEAVRASKQRAAILAAIAELEQNRTKS